MRCKIKNRINKKMKTIAIMLLLVFSCQLIFPNISLALTTGPSQPEVQGFEPVGTTDMVDMFSGSFIYNIPLLDIEGYPVNISYHGGITMEQEASWVGLGWNINPGTINRTVRGVPDDFNGDSLYKDFNIKPEKTMRVGMGVNGELVGVGDPVMKLNVSLGGNLNISNYRGVSADFTLGGGINVFHCVSAGVNLGIGSQTGASFDYNAGLSMRSSQIMGEDQAMGMGVNVGSGYSTRSGIKDLNLSFSMTRSQEGYRQSQEMLGSSDNIPIGVKNYVPVITNSSTMSSINGRIKLGTEIFGGYPYGDISAMMNILTYSNDASRGAYGYMYLQNAGKDNKSILDFTRDKDGMFNKSMQYLPVPNMTYDIFNVTGQGTGGMFRLFRNDFGNVYDPAVSSTSTSDGGEIELGLGNLYEAGLDYHNSGTMITAGPWYDYPAKGFTDSRPGSIYENVYLKSAGELTEVDSNYFIQTGGLNPITPDDFKKLPLIKPNSDTKRDPRANLVYYHTAQQDTVSGVGTNPYIFSYTGYNSDYSVPSYTSISRIGTGNFQRKKDQISEIVQVQKDGRKYVYGIPAMNNVQKEVTFSVGTGDIINLNDGIVNFEDSDATRHNLKGRDNYFSSTITPAYAHSYLLTSVLSADYVDLTGDGPTDDDLGSFTKFTYTRTDDDYRWVAPFPSRLSATRIDSAQYNPGFWCDPLDDKGSYVCGSREQWNLHSIETKNFIAEFYTSTRNDAQGIALPLGITSPRLFPGQADIYNATKTNPYSYSYKLDSIKLYNKHDRFINTTNAVPVKTVYFVYDESLCPGIPNTSIIGGGKLTLKKIYFSYGTSQKSMISPYKFDYGYNFGYSLASKDRWGNYKPNNPGFTNYEFPYTTQNYSSDSLYAGAWTLNKITLPSGGVVSATYESNDYAFVQDKPVNEMFMVTGIGNDTIFSNSNLLYANSSSHNLYAYFIRRPGSELPKLTFQQNYLGMNFKKDQQNCIYFNFNVQLTGANNTYEQIKGYANVTDAGICGGDTMKGYIKFSPVNPTGGGAVLNPVSYTAINVSRYNLPQIVFPGNNPNESDLQNILSGLKGSFYELLNMAHSPVVYLLKKGGAQVVNLNKSYLRLQSVGLTKMGGGQRVKSLSFLDQWQTLAGGNDSSATYGKVYNYTISDPTYGKISSGVASYEPMIGGDENPLRLPIQYTVQSGSNWPPNDPVDLYQETPIGESLYPPGQVGYSQVTVSSINASMGKSSQGIDLYQFYTAKDFPAQFIASSINTNSSNHYDFFSQKNSLTATQGYTLIFNDMHGKQKKVEHDVYNPASQTMQLISYQLYNYRKNGNKLNNYVPCLVPNGTGMVLQNKQLGLEEDITMDSRDKNEVTENTTANANMNFFIVPTIIPIAIGIPYSFTWTNESQNEFQSAAVTKVIQQYGILDNIQSYNEGAVTTLQNEIYDPKTGQVLVTSINNEFNDREYSTNIPAYWIYKGMGSSYNNICYKDTGKIAVGSHHIGTLNITNTVPLVAGDELSVFYTDAASVKHHTTAWVLGIVRGSLHLDTVLTWGDRPGLRIPGPDTNVIHTTWNTFWTTYVPTCTGLNVLPRFPINTPGWDSGTTLTNVQLEVINSGQSNLLNENVESYTSLDYPISGGALSSSLTNLISLKANTYADSNTMVLHDYIVNSDTVNPFGIGERGIWRPYRDYIYKTGRTYSGTSSRTMGLFNATSMLAPPTGLPTTCFLSPYNYLAPYFTDSNWHISRTISKYSPYGKEVENIDAVGNYSTAVFGYNQELPVAVASNAKQGDILTEGFEDYNLLQYQNNIMSFIYSPFNNFPSLPLFSPYDTLNIFTVSSAPYIMYKLAHTGQNCLCIPGSSVYTFNIPVNTNNYDTSLRNYYNSYYSTDPIFHYLFSSSNEYLPFKLIPGNNYIVSYWVLQTGTSSGLTDYTLPSGCCFTFTDGVSFFTSPPVVKKTNIIEMWQQYEATFSVPASAISATIGLPNSCYIDDLRIYPVNANMKSFVYNPYSEKLMATLDENNFATFYEYDQEGKLVRVKKETTKGIMTVSESRNGNPKH